MKRKTTRSARPRKRATPGARTRVTPVRSVASFQAYYTTATWAERRARIRQRAQGVCEFCRLRPMEHVHHRTYAHFGQERLSECMAVCLLCHRSIHAALRGQTVRVPCAVGSLVAQGDTGMGETPVWTLYLAQTRRKARRPARRW